LEQDLSSITNNLFNELKMRLLSLNYDEQVIMKLQSFNEIKTRALRQDILNKYKNMSLRGYLEEDEFKFLEFKSSMLWDKGKQKCSDKFLPLQIVIAIESFLNSDGGILLVGVDPDKRIVGIENDYNCLKKDEDFDGWSSFLADKIKKWLDNLVVKSILIVQEKHGDFTVAKIIVEKHYKPVYIRYADEKGERVEFYIRGINGKVPLDTEKIHEYIQNHWK
jgi:predicted HTH transcriptional regulator